MSGAEILTDSELWHAHDADELVHITCCFNDGVALCGGDVSGGIRGEHANCRMCVELDAEKVPCPAGFSCEQLDDLDGP